jgi:hypothetical protein
VPSGRKRSGWHAADGSNKRVAALPNAIQCGKFHDAHNVFIGRENVGKPHKEGAILRSAHYLLTKNAQHSILRLHQKESRDVGNDL